MQVLAIFHCNERHVTMIHHANGKRLDQAVITTFDFDMQTFLSSVGETNLERCIVFRGEGLFENKTDIPDDYVTKISFPLTEKCWPERFFHSKVALLSYIDDDGDKTYRLSIGSKNIYPFDNVEICLEFEGELTADKQEKNKPLEAFLSLLDSYLMGDDKSTKTKKAALQTFINDISHVRFRLLSPFACEDFEFFTPSVSQAPLFKEQYEELVVISPNIDAKELENLLALRNEGGKCYVITNPETLMDLIKNEVFEPSFLSLPINRYLHAKLYLIRKNGQFDLFAGSMNLSTYAIHKNIETMTYLRDVKNIKSIASFLSEFLAIPESTIQSTMNQYETDPTDRFLEAATNIQTRLRYLTHIANRNKYDAEEEKNNAAYLLSCRGEERIRTILTKEPFDVIPIKKEIKTGNKTRTAFVAEPLDGLCLGCINHAIHQYDHLFSKNVYLHVLGRRPRDIFVRIHQDKSFFDLHLFRTDIHDFDPSMKESILLERIHQLFQFDPELEGFLQRYVKFKSYRLEENGPLFNDGPAQFTGLPLAGLLENTYLHDFDALIEKKVDFYARCGDDILIGARTRQDAIDLASLTKHLLEEKGLALSKSKSFLLEPKQPVTYLGWKIADGQIDFTDEYLENTQRSIRRHAISIMRLNNNKPLRLMSVIKYVNAYLKKADFYASFQVITTTEGLKKIDRMIYEFIRMLASGNKGKSKYKIAHEDLRMCGYQTLVNAYYRYIKR